MKIMFYLQYLKTDWSNITKTNSETNKQTNKQTDRQADSGMPTVSYKNY